MSKKEIRPKQKRQRFADLVTKIPKTITDPKKNHTKYTIGRKIGSGTFSKCFELTEEETGKQFACKILSRKCDVECIQSEIEIHRDMKHSNIVPLIGIIKDRHNIYVQLKLCTNGTLKEFLNNHGIVSIDRSRYIINQILLGTQYIHNENIIHRDLKLANIFIDDRMQMRIGDFGLAIHVADIEFEKNQVCGTLRYLSPEVLQHDGFSFKSDVWAIGVMMFNLLLGRSPFECGNAQQTAKRIRKLDYSLPDGMDAEALRMLKAIFQKKSDNRPDTTQCLQMKFISNHILLTTLPTETLEPSKEFCSSNTLESHNVGIACIQILKSQNNMNHEFDVITEAELRSSLLNPVYAATVKKFHQTFDFLCRHYDATHHRREELIDHSELRPEFWITHWIHDDLFAYRLTDNTLGMLFGDGVKIMRLPHKRIYRTESGSGGHQIHEKIAHFEEFCQRLNKNADPVKLATSGEAPFLHTWFRTHDTMVLFLTNQTVQIQFLSSKHEIILHANTNSITFIKTYEDATKRITTIKIEQIACDGFNSTTLVYFKYLTSLLKYLFAKLEAASSV